MRAIWLADVLRDAGLKVHPLPGWETRGDNDLDLRGVIWHHTVTAPTRPDSDVDKWMGLTGRPPVAPAPLCNYSTNRDGSVSIIAAGTANHGGKGSWRGVAGNRFFLGDEMKNLGTLSAEPWDPVQLTSARKAAAAILRHIGQSSEWLCAHKEYAPTRKVDPHTLEMSFQRRMVADHMEAMDEMTPEQMEEVAELTAHKVLGSQLTDPSGIPRTVGWFLGQGYAGITRAIRAAELAAAQTTLARLGEALDDDVVVDVEALALEIRDGLGEEIAQALGRKLIA